MYRAITSAIASKARVKTSSSAALNADDVRLCYYDEAWRAIAWVLLANWKSNESVRWANAAEHQICAEYR